MFSAILYLSLLNPLEGVYEPIPAAAIEAAIVYEVDGQLSLSVAEGEQLCVSTSPGCDGAMMFLATGDLYLSAYDESWAYLAVPSASLYEAIVGDGELVFSGLSEGENVRIADGLGEEPQAMYLELVEL